MARRTGVPSKTRSAVLIANRHACCVCGKSGVVIHHINGNNRDHRAENLAVLCLGHHDEAHSSGGLSAALTSEHIVSYKGSWEETCASAAARVARMRTAFVLVDYKNAARIRQLYEQVPLLQKRRAAEQLRAEFQEESGLGQAKGVDVCIEPNTSWPRSTERMLQYVGTGVVQPDCFDDVPPHPRDALYPRAHAWQPEYPHYDLWCQIMVRVLVATRGVCDMEALLQLDDPAKASVAGMLASFSGSLKGEVVDPWQYEHTPTCSTLLTVGRGRTRWKSLLGLKTHYVYSDTAAMNLSKGPTDGLALLRRITHVERRETGYTFVHFACTPLILGIGLHTVPDP